MTTELELKQKFIELRAKGLSLAKISKELDKCRQTLSNWNSELEEEISNAKAIELESLFETCLATKEHRVKNLSELLQKISKEIEKRDFQDISTDKLVDLKLKLSEQLKDEYVEPKIRSDKAIEHSKNNKIILSELTKT